MFNFTWRDLFNPFSAVAGSIIQAFNAVEYNPDSWKERAHNRSQKERKMRRQRHHDRLVCRRNV